MDGQYITEAEEEVPFPTAEQCADLKNPHCTVKEGMSNFASESARVWRKWIQTKVKKLPESSKFGKSDHPRRYAGVNADVMLDAMAYEPKEVPANVYKHLHASCQVSSFSLGLAVTFCYIMLHCYIMLRFVTFCDPC